MPLVLYATNIVQSQRPDDVMFASRMPRQAQSRGRGDPLAIRAGRASRSLVLLGAVLAMFMLLSHGVARACQEGNEPGSPVAYTAVETATGYVAAAWATASPAFKSASDLGSAGSGCHGLSRCNGACCAGSCCPACTAGIIAAPWVETHGLCQQASNGRALTLVASTKPDAQFRPPWQSL